MENNYDNKEMQELFERYERFLHSDADSYLDSDEFAELAEYCSQQGDDEKAAEIIDHAIEVFPYALAPLSLKARLCLMYGRKADEAERYIEQAEDKSDIEYHYVKAEIAIVRDGAFAAEAYLSGVFNDIVQYESEQDQDDFFYDSATLFFDYEEYLFCLIWLNKTHRYHGDDFYHLLARTLFQLECFSDSERVFNRLLNNTPFDAEVWNEIALSQLAQDKVSEALTSAEYAIAIEPDNEIALHTKAHCLMLLGNQRDASKLFNNLSKEPS